MLQLERIGRRTIFCIIIIAIVSLVLSIIAGRTAVAGADEEDAFATFETFCIFKLDTPSEIPQMAKDAGGIETLAADARIYLGGQTGRAWMLRRERSPLVLVLANNGTCGLYAFEGNRAGMRSVIETLAGVLHTASEPIGTEMRDLYLLSMARKSGGPDFRTAIMLRTSQLASMRGVFLSAIPERLLIEEGKVPPRWPEPWRPK